MIDNYDSFTYNLVQYLQILKQDVEVHRNDVLTADDAIAEKPECIIISPGPGTPDNAGISVELIKKAHGSIPILGICLGHQCIGTAFGAQIEHAAYLMHGKVSEVEHDKTGIFEGLKSPFSATRYHSLSIVENTLPDCFNITARADDNEIMGIAHQDSLTVGLQFHPESILTVPGKRLLRNFLKMAEHKKRAVTYD